MSALHLAWAFIVLATAFASTVAGTWAFRTFALKRGIIATPNFRSLHKQPVPRGGGIVLSLVSLVAIAELWAAGLLDTDLAMVLLGGGSLATLVGFVDDTRQLRPRWKLLTQGFLAAFILSVFEAQPLVDLPASPVVFDLALSWLGLVWLMNLCNFVDGIDGMAATGAIFVSAASLLVHVMASNARSVEPDVGVGLVCGLIVAGCSAFLIFNWPPASIFMGESGSMFLGLALGALVASTIVGGQISLWTWLIIFGYLAGDTTTTTVVRIFVTDKWYGEHRSHAYQNLARIWGSHLRVVLGVSLYHIVWLLPLAIWSALVPATAPLAALLAVLPVVIWTLRHGPLRSST
jgi:Fuc2NAc and GlcNAc transferase